MCSRSLLWGINFISLLCMGVQSGPSDIYKVVCPGLQLCVNLHNCCPPSAH